MVPRSNPPNERARIAFFVNPRGKGGDFGVTLGTIFSGKIGINGVGIAGLVAMLLGAGVCLGAKRLSPRRVNLVKLAGLAVCALGAAAVIGFGK